MERLEKNILWLSAANISGSLFGAVLVVYLARVLEAENFGYLSYATALVFFLFSFVDLGLSTFGIREVAKDPDSVSGYVSNIVSFKLVVACAIFIVFAAFSAVCCRPMVVKLVMLEAGLMLFCSALATEWVFQGLEKMHMVLVSYAVTPLLQLALNVVFVKRPADVVWVPLIGFIGSVPVIVLFLHRLRFRPRLSHIDLGKIRLYLSSALAIWGISVFAQAYNNLDIVLLGFFRRPEEVGCFSVARRIAGGPGFLALLLANAVLPRLSCTFDSDIGQFNRAITKFLKIAALMIAIVFIPLMIFSREIVTLAVGAEYAAASAPLRIMTLAVILVMFNLPFSTGLVAARFEKDVLKQAFASASLSLILNLVLMPKYGMIGASVAFLSAELLALIWILAVYHKRIRLCAAA